MEDLSTPKNASLPQPPNRRDFLKGVAGAGALAGISLPHVHSQVNDTIQIALVGCGGRGTGAVNNALRVPGDQGSAKLVAMADVFAAKLKRSYDSLKKLHKDKIDVPPERRHIGFDGYKHAMDALKPGDVVIFTTPCAFRWVHYQYAIEKGLNVFMEKPLTPDGYSSRKMLELNQQALAKNLKVGVGLMCRHSQARLELKQRIEDGQLGDLMLLRAYRLQPPIVTCFSTKKPAGESELLYQIRRFHSFLWLSGGSFSDFFIHNIDECCWMKGAWPVKAQAIGGRHYRGNNIDQNFDSYSVEYTFADEAKMYMHGRNVPGCYGEFASHAHGTKGYALVSGPGGHRSQARIHKGLGPKSDVAWTFGSRKGRKPATESNPYQDEWNHLLHAIRNELPYNEVERGVAASLVTSMGRMAAHTGQSITYEQMLAANQFGPGIDKLTMESNPPLMPNQDGVYPVPQPGVQKTREY